jgi:hypothetical protein
MQPGSHYKMRWLARQPTTGIRSVTGDSDRSPHLSDVKARGPLPRYSRALQMRRPACSSTLGQYWHAGGCRMASCSSVSPGSTWRQHLIASVHLQGIQACVWLVGRNNRGMDKQATCRRQSGVSGVPAVPKRQDQSDLPLLTDLQEGLRDKTERKCTYM